MIKKITTFLLLIVILTSLFIIVFSSLAYANRPNYTVCKSWITIWSRCHNDGWIWVYQKRWCCTGFGGSGGYMECGWFYRSYRSILPCG